MNIQIQNSHQEIVSSNYWDSQLAKQGLRFVSTNAGCVRLLVPDALRHEIPDMINGAKHFVISILRNISPQTLGYVLEILIEDGTANPYSLHFSVGSFDLLPSPGTNWEAAIWGQKDSKPHKFVQLNAYVRYADRLPCLQPYDPALGSAASSDGTAKSTRHTSPTTSWSDFDINAEIDEIINRSIGRAAPYQTPTLTFGIYRSDEDYELTRERNRVSHEVYKTMIEAILTKAPTRGVRLVLKEFRGKLFKDWVTAFGTGEFGKDIEAFISDLNFALRCKTIAPYSTRHERLYVQSFHTRTGEEHRLAGLSEKDIDLALSLLDDIESCIYKEESWAFLTEYGITVYITGLGDPELHKQAQRRCPKLAKSELIVCLVKEGADVTYHSGSIQDMRDSLSFALAKLTKSAPTGT